MKPSLLSPQSLVLSPLLFLASEILFWNSPHNRPPADWLPLLAGYLALGALLLDSAVRFRARDLFGLLTLAGVYGLLASLLLNPSVALADVPLTLLTRALGTQTIAGLVALLLCLALLHGRFHISLLAASLVTGAIWGIWARWFPPALDPRLSAPPLATMLAYGAGGLALAAGVWMLLARSAGFAAENFRLSRPAWLVTLAVLVALLLYRLAQGAIDSVSLVVIPSLLAFLALLLWFQRGKREASLLEAASPPAFSPIVFLAAALLFLAAGVVGYSLPRGEGDSDLLALLGAAFTAFGIVWLPAVTLVFGGRAFLRAIRTQPL